MAVTTDDCSLLRPKSGQDQLGGQGTQRTSAAASDTCRWMGSTIRSDPGHGVVALELSCLGVGNGRMMIIGDRHYVGNRIRQ